MADRTDIQVTVDSAMKEQAEKVLEQLGLDIPGAFRMFLASVVREQGLPFGTRIGKEPAAEQKPCGTASQDGLRERIRALLEEINPDIDYDLCESLVEDGELDSLQILTLVVSMEEEFHISIDPAEVNAENFNSLRLMTDLIGRHL